MDSKDSSSDADRAELLRLVAEDRAESAPPTAVRQGTPQGALSHAILHLAATSERRR